MVSSLIALLAAGAFAPLAFACDPYPNNPTQRFAQWPITFGRSWHRVAGPGVSYSSARAAVDIKTPDVFPMVNTAPNQNWSYTWVMLHNGNGSWAQYGPMVRNDGSRENHIQ